MQKGRRSRGLQRRGKCRIAKKDLVVRRGQGNSWEKEDCRGKKRIERRKVQLSPPKAKIVQNRCNPGRIAEKCEQSCSGFEGGIREAFRGERGPSPPATFHALLRTMLLPPCMKLQVWSWFAQLDSVHRDAHQSCPSACHRCPSYCSRLFAAAQLRLPCQRAS